MGRITIKRPAIAGIAAAVVVLGAGGTAIAAATSGDDASAPPLPPEAAAPVRAAATATTPATAKPGLKPVNLRLTTGDYAVDVLEWDSVNGQGLGTIVAPHTVQDLRSYDQPGYDITEEQYFLATESGALPTEPRQPHGTLIASVPQPAAGQVLDCVATGSAADPAIHCTTK